MVHGRLAAPRTQAPKRLMRFLLLTIAFAGVFLGIKYIEYSHKFHEGLLPGRFYSPPRRYRARRVHVLQLLFHDDGPAWHCTSSAGMVAISWVVRRAIRGDFSPHYYTPVDLVGLYWHLVDLIWIYLFPLLYLIK